MDKKHTHELSDLTGKRSLIPAEAKLIVSDPGESSTITGFQANYPEISKQPLSDPSAERSLTIPKCVTVTRAANLLSIAVATIRRNCASGKYTGARKEQSNGGEGWFIPVASLPLHAQAKLAEEVRAELAVRIS